MSVATNVGGLDHRPPFRDLLLLVSGKDFRRLLRRRRDLLPNIPEPLQNGLISESVPEGSVEAGDNVGRRATRSPNGVPVQEMEPSHARFVGRRNLGRGWQTLGG